MLEVIEEDDPSKPQADSDGREFDVDLDPDRALPGEGEATGDHDR